MISVSRGLGMMLSVAIMLAIFGIVMLVMAFSGLWILLPFSLACFGAATCTSGIDFNTTTKTYREYYAFLGIKTGSWKSYQDFCFVSCHPATLVRNINVSRVQEPINTYEQEVMKVILLNKEHNKKLFVKYLKNSTGTPKFMQELAGDLHFEVVTYHPPIPESRLRRSRKFKS